MLLGLKRPRSPLKAGAVGGGAWRLLSHWMLSRDMLCERFATVRDVVAAGAVYVDDLDAFDVTLW